MDNEILTRPVRPDDLPFLWEMLWEAVAVDAGMRAMGKAAALAHPLSRKYLEGWGRPGDFGVVAVDAAGVCLGAAWCRVFPADAPGYGFVAPDVPELAIGVRPEAQGRGVGGALLDALLHAAREQGFPAVSLSVDRRNPAVRLYARKGFHPATDPGENETSLTLVVGLQTDTTTHPAADG